MNVLIITSHHDDLEIGCGATVAKMRDQGHKVISLVMTHSGYSGPNGEIIRTQEDAKNEASFASKTLDYELISYEEDTFDIEVSDKNIRKILRVIQEKQIDTVFTHYHNDIHPPHNKVYQMVIHACRHIPRIFGIQSNWYIGKDIFSPNLFIAINESQWERKIEAIKCYESEFNRTGSKWLEFLNNRSLYYGLLIGVKRAEGFYIYKQLWNF